MIYYSSDLHFNHANILKFCDKSRLFSSVDEMNKKLIENWNSIVTNEDTVYFLGDFAFGPRGEYQGFFDQLKGKKRLIKGNHDCNTTYNLGWESVNMYYEVKDGSDNVVLFHYPMEDWNRRFHGSYHFHGHVHSSIHVPYRYVKNRCDVGVDNFDMKPVTISQVKEFMDVNSIH